MNIKMNLNGKSDFKNERMELRQFREMKREKSPHPFESYL
jgi:hypothetical protein